MMGVNHRRYQIKKDARICSHMMSFHKTSRNVELVVNSASGDSGVSVGSDVPFPNDYTQLLQQAKEATEMALKDKRQLMNSREVVSNKFLHRKLNFPPLDCNLFQFFPEANEVKFARTSAFEGASFKLDYLTKPSLFEDFGFVEKVKMADRVKTDDELFLVAYPYFNVNEMLVVDELYKEAVVNTSRALIIFNGELDRIRSGYYPPFFYPKLAVLSKTLLPKMETVYYIHNFKGRNGGVLFRCYPGPWRVLRKVRTRYICLHEQESMPTLKEVALDILPSA